MSAAPKFTPRKPGFYSHAQQQADWKARAGWCAYAMCANRATVFSSSSRSLSVARGGVGMRTASAARRNIVTYRGLCDACAALEKVSQ